MAETRPTQLTELETAIIGVVWRRGPCSAYAVQTEFAASPTIRWSSSAGSIYPALKRLEQRSLVTAEQHRWGKSTKKLFAVSATGRAELTDWILNIDGVAGPSYDAIRTRFFFLDALPTADERLRVVARAAEETAEEITRMKRVYCEAQNGPAAEFLAVRGGLMELETRLQWLQQVKEELKLAV